MSFYKSHCSHLNKQNVLCFSGNFKVQIHSRRVYDMTKYKQLKVLIKANLEGKISLKNIIYLSSLYLTTYSCILLDFDYAKWPTLRNNKTLNWIYITYSQLQSHWVFPYNTNNIQNNFLITFYQFLSISLSDKIRNPFKTFSVSILINVLCEDKFYSTKKVCFISD